MECVHEYRMSNYEEVNIGVVVTHQCIHCQYSTFVITRKEFLSFIEEKLCEELTAH